MGGLVPRLSRGEGIARDSHANYPRMRGIRGGARCLSSDRKSTGMVGAEQGEFFVPVTLNGDGDFISQTDISSGTNVLVEKERGSLSSIGVWIERKSI